MKAIRIPWNVFLLAVGLYGVFWLVGPMLYAQVRFQFTDPRANDPRWPSMWPATTAIALYLISFVAFLAGLSHLISRTLSKAARWMSGTLALMLFGAWIAQTFFVLTLFHQQGFWEAASISTLQEMLNFDGSGFVVIAVISFSIAAASGKGPLSHAGDFVTRKILRKKPSA